MRKFSNQEASDVETLVEITEQIRLMERELRALKKKQKPVKALVKSIATKHGEAHSANHIITVSEEPRDGYVVADYVFDKFNIANR